MATVITSTLKASGGDFSSIKDWIAHLLANTPDFVANDIIPTLECYNDWPSGLDEDFVDFKSGFTTDADHYFRIVAADGEGHTGVAGTGFWFNSTAAGVVFYPRSHHVIFDGLELSAPNSSQDMFGASSNTIIKNCILHDIVSQGFSRTSGAIFENCIMYLTAPSSSSNVGKAAQNAKLINVTAYISENSGAFSGDIVFQSCDCTNVYMYHNRAKTNYDSFFNCTGDYNVALAINGDMPGSNSFFITDDSDLEDPDNFDFRLKSTSPLMTAGENGGPIGAVFASEPSGSVISEAYGIKSGQLINQLDSAKTSISTLSTIALNQKIAELLSTKISISEVEAVKSSQLLVDVGSVKTALSTVNSVKSEQIVNNVDSVKTSTSNLSATSSPQKIALISDSGGTASAIYTIKSWQNLALLTSTKSARSLIGTIESKQSLTSISSIAVRESALSAIKSEGLIANLSSYAIKPSSAATIKSSQNVISIDSYAVKVSTAYAIKSAQLINGIYKYTGAMPTFGWDDVVTISRTKTAKLKSETKLHSVISASKTYNTDSKTKIMRVTNDLH